MIKAIIFDFDGLIIDTETPAVTSWLDVFERHGCPITLDAWQKYIGAGSLRDEKLALLESMAGRPIDRAAASRWRTARKTELVSVELLRPGVEEYVLSAKRLDLKIGLASSSTRAGVSGHLARLGLLSYFDDLKCEEDVTAVKPDPALYLAAMKALGVAPNEAVALEDSPHGIVAARRAGLYCVAVPVPIARDLDFSQADIVLESLAELPLEVLLEALRNRVVPHPSDWT